jgi:hypothetical protein
MIPYKPYVRGKHVESILGTRKNMNKKSIHLNNTIPHSVRLVNPFKSRAVAKVNPSISCNTVLIFGIGKGFLINLLLTSQKLLRKRTVLLFFGIISEGLAHSDAGCHSNTLSLKSLSTSLIRVSYVSLRLRKLGCDTETHPPLVERRPALVSSHPRCHQRASHIS